MIYSHQLDRTIADVLETIVTSATNGCLDTAFVTLHASPCDTGHCTLTQGGWGNAGGKFNGIPRLALIQQLLASGPLVIGWPPVSRSFSVAQADAYCIIERMPAGGPSATLPAGPSQPTATPIRLSVRKWTSATANKYSTGTAWQTAATAYNVSLAGGFIDGQPLNDQGYYVVTAFAEDGAANASASVTRTYLYDITAPAAGAFAIPVLTAAAGQSNLFTATATDNIDIASTQWRMDYPALPLLLPPNTYGAFQSWTTSATSSANYPLYRALYAGGFAANQKLFGVEQSVTDRAGLTTGLVFQAIPAVNLPAEAATDPYASVTGFTYTGFAVQTVTTPTAVDIDGASIAAGNAASATINATLTGPSNVTINPFVRVEFWIAGPFGLQQIGTAGAPTVVDNATNRVYTWTISWNPDKVGSYNNPNAAGAQSIIAIGVNATNEGRSAIPASRVIRSAARTSARVWPFCSRASTTSLNDSAAETMNTHPSAAKSGISARCRTRCSILAVKSNVRPGNAACSSRVTRRA